MRISVVDRAQCLPLGLLVEIIQGGLQVRISVVDRLQCLPLEPEKFQGGRQVLIAHVTQALSTIEIMALIPPIVIAMKETKRELTTLKGTGENMTIADTLEQVDLTLEEGVNMMTEGLEQIDLTLEEGVNLMTEGLDTGENITTVGALEEELTNQSDRHLPATPSIEIQELGQNIMKGIAAMVGGIMKTGVEWKREIMVMENL